jgi:hypothetical protein
MSQNLKDFILNCEEKISANLQIIIELFIKKFSLSSQKYRFGIRDPRSGIQDPGSEIQARKKPIPDPGSKRHRSRIQIRTLHKSLLKQSKN